MAARASDGSTKWRFGALRNRARERRCQRLEVVGHGATVEGAITAAGIGGQRGEFPREPDHGFGLPPG